MTTSTPRVLISDKIDPAAITIFKDAGVEVDYKPGLSSDELASILPQYDGLAIRSSSKVTAALLQNPGKLKVIGRAGIGVDNVDVPAATKAGVIVMNTPYGNSVTTAEHAIALMMALVRQIPQASSSTHEGRWEKSKFMGTELRGKTLGIIGCGNIGSIVADRALGLKMKVVAADPFLTAERALDIGVEKVEIPELLKRADVITVHTPLTPDTRYVLNHDTLAQTKKGVFIINCARGGLIDEAALKAALDNGQVAGAALDVFEIEPATDHPLFGNEKVICTPHLGASTSEAQVAVALQIAEQMSAYLTQGAVENALNLPNISAADAPLLKPYLPLASALGTMASQLAKDFDDIGILYAGDVADLNVKPLTCEILAGMMSGSIDSVNRVNAPAIAKERGIKLTEGKTEEANPWTTAITIKAGGHSVAGSLFGTEGARIVAIDGVSVESPITPFMLLIRNQDRPGLIGGVGRALGEAGVNIGDFRLGRTADGHAIALVSVDSKITPDTFATLCQLPHMEQVLSLTF